MAEKPSRSYFSYSPDSGRANQKFPENIREENEDEDEYEEDLFHDHPGYPMIQRSSIHHNVNNDHQKVSPPLPSSSVTNPSAQFELMINLGDPEDEDGNQIDINYLNLPPPAPIHIQRVSSEDELNFSSKRKRAKFIGPYLFGDVIGQGSYGKVKECLDRRNLCRRAVKIMQRRRLRKTPLGEKMAATEIQILKKLNHPNVIRLYDFMRNDEKQKLYLFIDLCVISLQEMLDAAQEQISMKSFPAWQAHGYFVQLIQGLEYLHSKFIIHNDIKPGNLLITVDHQLKITDFGTAEQLDMFSPDDTIKRSQGTPAFQCPEIANGAESYRGFSVDVWSCGVTLYNLVTGKLPFEADNIYLLFQTIGTGIYEIPDDIEPHLRSLLAGLLHIDTDRRFSIEQIKQHDWFRRRPPRTFEFLPFPKTALLRFETCTMFDYLTELHQSTSETDDDQHSLVNSNLPDGSISLINNNSTGNHRNEPLETATNRDHRRQNHRRHSIWSCACNRSTSDDHLAQSSRSNRACLLS